MEADYRRRLRARRQELLRLRDEEREVRLKGWRRVP